MIARFLVVAAALCLGSIYCQNPPKLPQQFISNISVVLPNYASPISIKGLLALDYINTGAFIEIGGEEFVPLSMHTQFVASPNGQGSVTGYMYEGPLCWDFGSIPTFLVALFPFQIPSNASFTGHQVIEGQSCSGWIFTLHYLNIPIPVAIWVSNKSNAIVQVHIGDLKYVGSVQINFFNTAVGPFSPSIYAPPNPKLSCTKAWIRNPLSVLFRS